MRLILVAIYSQLRCNLDANDTQLQSSTIGNVPPVSPQICCFERCRVLTAGRKDDLNVASEIHALEFE
jgi:hypothetical protein